MEKLLDRYVNSDVFKKPLNIRSNSHIDLTLLGRGEYNINYTFTHPNTGQKLVFRINTASQMNLENQIEYEYNALKVLEKTKRTPRVYYVDGSKTYLPYGMLAMEYLEGRKLNYDTDLEKAAAIFADIHSCSIEGTDFLVKPNNLTGAILDECVSMSNVYLSSEAGIIEVKKRIERIINKTVQRLDTAINSVKDLSIVNTEVNSGNFIINDDLERCYLIDWEKPILGEPAQDLAHFSAPTTTFWKTDSIFTEEEQYEFVDMYIKYLNKGIDTEGLIDRFRFYLPLNCLRGITWCSMAWVQYNNGSAPIKNEDTYKKINDYLSEGFLNMIEERYFR